MRPIVTRRARSATALRVDQVILLNQAGRTTHADICASLEMFAREVMPEFHAREPRHQQWKADVLAGRIPLADEHAERYTRYAHQNEDIVRLTPEQLKARMAEKERQASPRG